MDLNRQHELVVVLGCQARYVEITLTNSMLENRRTSIPKGFNKITNDGLRKTITPQIEFQFDPDRLVKMDVKPKRSWGNH